jgi:DNA-binding LacI/PurR family transcriptional regulator
VVASRAAEAGALLAAANQLGIRVPDDLAIAAYVDEDTAPDRDELGLPLLLAQVPFAAIGRAATALLIGKLATPGRPLPSVAVPFGPLVGTAGKD